MKPSLLGFGMIQTDPAHPIDVRINTGTKRLESILDTINDPLSVVIEKPPETIYGQAKGINAVVSRSVSLFKVFNMLGGFITILNQRGINRRFLEPSQWQPSEAIRKAFCGSDDTKKWTLAAAPYELKRRFNYTKAEPKLKDHNVCDGINIGMVSIDKFINGIWLPPEREVSHG